MGYFCFSIHLLFKPVIAKTTKNRQFFAIIRQSLRRYARRSYKAPAARTWIFRTSLIPTVIGAIFLFCSVVNADLRTASFAPLLPIVMAIILARHFLYLRLFHFWICFSRREICYFIASLRHPSQSYCGIPSAGLNRKSRIPIHFTNKFHVATRGQAAIVLITLSNNLYAMCSGRYRE